MSCTYPVKKRLNDMTRLLLNRNDIKEAHKLKQINVMM